MAAHREARVDDGELAGRVVEDRLGDVARVEVEPEPHEQAGRILLDTRVHGLAARIEERQTRIPDDVEHDRMAVVVRVQRMEDEAGRDLVPAHGRLRVVP